MSELPPPLRPVATPLPAAAAAGSAPLTPGCPPRLTVVTPSFNQAPFLEATLRSVLEQDYPNLEYIVIDGQSTDGSDAILRHYAPWLHYWVSERDAGQVDALCKGLERATGEWFVWINSDDLLAPGALRTVAASAGAVDVIAGSTRHFDATGLLQTYRPRNISAANVVSELLRPGTRWQQPSTWFRTSQLRAIGLNRDLHFAFDYELMIRYLFRFPRVRYLDDTLAYFREHPASKTVSQPRSFLLEQIRIYRELQQDPALAPLHALLRDVERRVRCLSYTEELLDERSRSRWARLGELIRAIHRNPGTLGYRTTLRTVRRLLLYGGHRRSRTP